LLIDLPAEGSMLVTAQRLSRDVRTCPVTSQHRRIFKALADGSTDAEVAARLFVSLKTLRRRLAEVMQTHDIRTRQQLGAESVRRGWTDERAIPVCDCACPNPWAASRGHLGGVPRQAGAA
jgi:DNA-binding NarL/FixJ family response regulator